MRHLKVGIPIEAEIYDYYLHLLASTCIQLHSLPSALVMLHTHPQSFSTFPCWLGSNCAQ